MQKATAAVTETDATDDNITESFESKPDASTHLFMSLSASEHPEHRKKSITKSTAG